MAARTLLIVRHAKSDWEARRAGPRAPAQRPRSARGAGARAAARRGRAAPGPRGLLGCDAGPADLAARRRRPGPTRRRCGSTAGSTTPAAPRCWPSSPRPPDDVTDLACVGHEPTSSALAAVLAGERRAGRGRAAGGWAEDGLRGCADLRRAVVRPRAGHRPPGPARLARDDRRAPDRRDARPPYVAVIFTSVRTPGTDGYAAMSAAMDRLAAEQPGYLGIESAREASASPCRTGATRTRPGPGSRSPPISGAQRLGPGAVVPATTRCGSRPSRLRRTHSRPRAAVRPRPPGADGPVAGPPGGEPASACRQPVASASAASISSRVMPSRNSTASR